MRCSAAWAARSVLSWRRRSNLSVFKFGEIRVDVHRTGPDPLSPNIDFYMVKISHEDAFVESLTKKPKANRTAGSDFEIAAEAVSGMYLTAMNPYEWASIMQADGVMTQEEIDAVAAVAQTLKPYMPEAMESTRGRFELYQEHYEKGVGPLELGISRRLKLPDHIGNKEEIAEFFAYLYTVDHLSFHPDENFEGYVESGTGKAFYTAEEAAQMDALMLEAIQAADAEGLDIYELALWVGALTGSNDDPENEASAPAWLKSLSNEWV